VELVKKPTVRVSGVVSVGGAPLAGVDVRLDETPLATRSDAQGRFSFPTVPTGSYRLVAEFADFSVEDRDLAVQADTELELSIELRALFEHDQDPASPNPFRETTRLTYRLSTPERVRISVFDPGGREVRRLLDAEMTAGPHDLVWDGRDDDGRRLPQGMYFQRFAAGDRERIQRLIVLR
jgi:hypothetical protein